MRLSFQNVGIYATDAGNQESSTGSGFNNMYMKLNKNSAWTRETKNNADTGMKRRK